MSEKMIAKYIDDIQGYETILPNKYNKLSLPFIYRMYEKINIDWYYIVHNYNLDMKNLDKISDYLMTKRKIQYPTKKKISKRKKQY